MVRIAPIRYHPDAPNQADQSLMSTEFEWEQIVVHTFVDALGEAGVPNVALPVNQIEISPFLNESLEVDLSARGRGLMGDGGYRYKAETVPPDNETNGMRPYLYWGGLNMFLAAKADRLNELASRLETEGGSDWEGAAHLAALLEGFAFGDCMQGTPEGFRRASHQWNCWALREGLTVLLEVLDNDRCGWRSPEALQRLSIALKQGKLLAEQHLESLREQVAAERRAAEGRFSSLTPLGVWDRTTALACSGAPPTVGPARLQVSAKSDVANCRSANRNNNPGNRNNNIGFRLASSPRRPKAAVHGRPPSARVVTRAAVPRPRWGTKSKGRPAPPGPVAPPLYPGTHSSLQEVIMRALVIVATLAVCVAPIAAHADTGYSNLFTIDLQDTQPGGAPAAGFSWSPQGPSPGAVVSHHRSKLEQPTSQPQADSLLLIH